VLGAGAQVAHGIKWIKHTRSAHEGAASNCLSTVIQRQRSKAGAQKREPKQGDGGQRQAVMAGAEQLVGTGEGSRKGSKSTEADSIPWKGSRGAQRRRAVLEAGRCGNGAIPNKKKDGGRQRRIEAMGAVSGKQGGGGAAWPPSAGRFTARNMDDRKAHWKRGAVGTGVGTTAPTGAKQCTRHRCGLLEGTKRGARRRWKRGSTGMGREQQRR
jgi:hypothetical protein